MSDYTEALKAELAYVKAQPEVDGQRVKEIEAEIARVSPPEVERAVDEAAENTAGPASRAAKKKA